MTKRALITGITGQDGSYLAELLLDKGYEVIGMVRRSSTLNFERIAHLQDRITLVPGDLLDEVSMINLLREHRPTEVYNLAAQSFVQTSWGQPVLTGETHTVREFVELAFGHVDLDWEKYVVLDERFMRPAEVDLLIGDPAKANKVLGWKPKMPFPELVHTMVDADLELLSGPLSGLR